MSKKAEYRITSADRDGFFVMRLHPVATFSEDTLASEFAAMKNGNSPTGIYSVAEENGNFYVLRDERIALFLTEELAKEYVAIKEYRAVPNVQMNAAAPAVDNDAIWAEAATMVNAGK